MNPVSKEQIVDELRALVKQHPSDAKAAEAIKCTPAQLSTTLSGKNNIIPVRILVALGYVAQMAYFKADEVPKTKKAKKAAKKDVYKRAAKEAYKKAAKKTSKKKRVVAKPKELAAPYTAPSVAQPVGNGSVAIRNTDASNTPTNFIKLGG